MDSLNTFEDENTSSSLYPHTKLVNASVEFLPWGLVMLILCFVGIIGNLLSALVLRRHKMTSTYSTLTLGLTFCDAMYLTTQFLFYSLPSIFFYFELTEGSNIFFPIIGPKIRPINYTASTATTYMTVAIAVDRYLAVCWPYKARQFSTRRKALWTILIVILFSIVYNFPRWWEFRTEVNYTFTTGSNNETITTYYKMSQLPFRNDPVYKTYYIFWTYFFVLFLIPVASLSTFNYCIWKTMQASAEKRVRLTSRQRDENSFAVMLLAVVVVFLICSCVFPILDIIDFAGYKYNDMYTHIGQVMLTLNSSVNFIIYCLFGRRFREEFFALFFEITACLKLSKNKGDVSLSGTSKPSDFTGDRSDP